MQQVETLQGMSLLCKCIIKQESCVNAVEIIILSTVSLAVSSVSSQSGQLYQFQVLLMNNQTTRESYQISWGGGEG